MRTPHLFCLDQPLLHSKLTKSMPQGTVGHRPPTQDLMDNMLLQHQSCYLCSRFFAGFHILYGFGRGMSVQTTRT